jgi:hypothetical protein
VIEGTTTGGFFRVASVDAQRDVLLRRLLDHLDHADGSSAAASSGSTRRTRAQRRARGLAGGDPDGRRDPPPGPTAPGRIRLGDAAAGEDGRNARCANCYVATARTPTLNQPTNRLSREGKAP